MIKMALNSSEKPGQDDKLLSPPVSERGRHQSKTTRDDSNFNRGTNISSTISGINDEFQRVLGDLEKRFLDFDENLRRSGGLKQINRPGFSASSLSSSSYTLTLARMVSSLLEYVREMSSELSHEKMKQAELTKQLDIHRKLIDGLTSEILLVKDQNQKIIAENVNQNAKFEAELDQIKVNYPIQSL